MSKFYIYTLFKNNDEQPLALIICNKEVLIWITSQRNEILDDPQQNILTTKTKKQGADYAIK